MAAATGRPSASNRYAETILLCSSKRTSTRPTEVAKDCLALKPRRPASISGKSTLRGRNSRAAFVYVQGLRLSRVQASRRRPKQERHRHDETDDADDQQDRADLIDFDAGAVRLRQHGTASIGSDPDRKRFARGCEDRRWCYTESGYSRWWLRAREFRRYTDGCPGDRGFGGCEDHERRADGCDHRQNRGCGIDQRSPAESRRPRRWRNDISPGCPRRGES